MKKLYQRILSMALSLSMLLSMAVTAGAVEETDVLDDAAISPIIEVTVTETTETGATIHIKNNKDYGTNQIGFYKVLKKSEQGFDSAQALITSFGDITDSTTMMAACIPEFLAGPPTFTAQTEATKTVSDLEAGTEYVVYAAIGDYYAMATSNDYSGCSFAAVEFTTKTDGGGETPEPTVPEDATTELSYQENGKEEITTVYYEKFEDATVALNVLANCSNITLTLLQDTTIQPTKAYGYAAVIQKSCTLDLNGYVLTAYSGIVGSITGGLLVEGEVHFVLTDSSEERSGMILSKAGSASMITGLAIGSGFSDSVYEKLPGDITFEMNGTVVKDANYDQPKAVKGCLSISDSCVSAELNDSVVYGAVTTNCDSLELNNSRVEANTEGQRVLTFSGKLIMNESVIANTYDGSAESCTVSYYRGANEIVDVGTILKLTDSTISAGSGTALNLGMNQKVKYAVDLNEGAHILSDSGIGIYVDSQMVGPSWYDEENPAPHAAIHLYAGSVVSGASAIEVAVGTKNYKLSDVTKVIRIEMDDGAFLGYDNVPVLPNSSVMTYPTGMVLDVDASNQAGFEEYYTLKNTAEMDQIIDTITFGYQYLATLNATIEGTRNLYVAGNADNTYDTVLWNAFTEAYEAAIALIGTDETAANLNANQNEIDYREQQLSAAALALQESVDTVDLSNLANGTYSIEIQMMHSRDDGSFSMANGAVERTATLTIEDGKKTLSVNFKPMELGPINGHLLKFWVYNAPTPDEAKSFNQSYIQDNYVVHSNYYNQDGTNDPIYDADGMYPGTITFELPYFGSTDGYNKIYGRVSVDAMASDQNVIMLLQYHTLKAIEVEDTLSVDTTEVSLLKGDTQAVNAKVLGADGYALSVNSDNANVATAAIEDGTITITAVGAGTANITVTATNGTNTLTKTITVTVAEEGKTAVEADASVSGSAATATISGDVLVTAGGDGSVDAGSTVTVNAKGETGNTITSAAVTIEASAADALAGSKKDVEIQTNMGSVTLDAALMQQVANAEGDVVLTVQNGTLPSGTQGDFEETYDLTLTAGDSSVSFGSGQATVTVPTTLTSNGYAYCIGSDGAKTERQLLAVSEGYGTWTTTHFSTWALSANEYTVDSDSGQGGGGGTTVPDEDEYFLSDGNYYVDIDLYKEDSNTESMGNVAFKNNDRALVTVEDGEITTVQIATNPVDVSGYHSAIITFKVEGAAVRVLETGDLTTTHNGEVIQEGYTYVKLVEFTMPSAGQPEFEDEVTYLPVTFYVPDTPMDSVVDATNGLNARIKFTWSTASATSDSSLEQDDSSATGTSSITGEEIVDVNLTDKDTGIKLITDSERLSNEAALSVEKLTSGSDYDTAVKAMSGIKDSWSLYNITAQVDGKVTAPEGSVTLSIPCTKDGLTVYRINASGTKTVLKGEIKDGYYVLNTSSLGLFAVVGTLGEARELPFTDVATGSWYYDGVKYAVEKGLFTGTSATTFAPNMELTRSMLVTVLYRLAGSPEVSQSENFSDVQADSWYEDAVIWAAANGVVAGYGGGVFGPDDDITREQLAVILYRYAQLTEQDVDTETDLTAYSDAGEVSDFAREAMVWAVENGLISGTSATTLSPKGTATRAQVAVILMRYLEQLNK